MHKVNGLTEFSVDVYNHCCKQGFYDDVAKLQDVADDLLYLSIMSRLALIQSEVSEAIECVRKGEPLVLDEMLKSDYINDRFTFADSIKDSFSDELADTVIRIMDLCGFLGIDIDFHINEKMKYNLDRAYKHGKVC